MNAQTSHKEYWFNVKKFNQFHLRKFDNTSGDWTCRKLRKKPWILFAFSKKTSEKSLRHRRYFSSIKQTIRRKKYHFSINQSALQNRIMFMEWKAAMNMERQKNFARKNHRTKIENTRWGGKMKREKAHFNRDYRCFKFFYIFLYKTFS